MIRASEHQALIHVLLERYGLPADCVEIVPDVRAWCLQRRIAAPKMKSERAAVSFSRGDSCAIVLRDEQTDRMIHSAKQLMELFGGYGKEVAELKDDVAYLAHLVLHEIAYFKLKTTKQDPRDKWAFQQLPGALAAARASSQSFSGSRL
ncbi:MAG TPA: hypothetical protein VFU71_11215 [Burkholderiaceae bacterium]|nr:hypothetical protein [Burkholderiaceae bacterium]